MPQEPEGTGDQKLPHWSSIRFDGCGTGCCLGAVSAPCLLVLFLEVLHRVAGKFDAEGIPFFLIVSVPIGGIVGSITYPILRTIGLIVIAKIKSRSTRQ
jgi:hypothetical protein